MTTTKERISAGQTLVANYKGDQHSCEVVEHEAKLFFVLPSGEVFKCPSAAGHAITGTATNGYRFWSVPEQMPSGQGGRQRAAREAVASALAGAPSALGSKDPAVKVIERAKSQKGVPDGQVRYFCSSCMRAFVAVDAGRRHAGWLPWTERRAAQGHAPRADGAGDDAGGGRGQG